MTLGSGISALALVVLGATPTTSPRLPVRVDFVAPLGCSSESAFYAAVRARTEHVRSAEASEQALQFRVRLSLSGGYIVGELQVVDEHGETDTRRVEGVSCSEVVEALSLTAALAADRTAELKAPEASSQTNLDESSSAGPPASAQPAGSNRPPSAPRPTGDEAGIGQYSPSIEPWAFSLSFELGLKSFLTEIVSPELSIGGGIFGRMSTQGWGTRSSVELAVLHAPERFFQPSTDLSIRWTAMALSACPVSLDLVAVRIEPCALASGGWMVVKHRTIPNPVTAVRSWWSAGGALRASAALGEHIVFSFETALTFPLLHRRFVTLDPERAVGETPNVSALGALAVGYVF